MVSFSFFPGSFVIILFVSGNMGIANRFDVGPLVAQPFLIAAPKLMFNSNISRRLDAGDLYACLIIYALGFDSENGTYPLSPCVCVTIN